jgi:hypothetical protein
VFSLEQQISYNKSKRQEDSLASKLEIGPVEAVLALAADLSVVLTHTRMFAGLRGIKAPFRVP